MIPVQIRPDQALEELTNFSQKLGHGLQNLMEVLGTFVYRESELVGVYEEAIGALDSGE